MRRSVATRTGRAVRALDRERQAKVEILRHWHVPDRGCCLAVAECEDLLIGDGAVERSVLSFAQR